MSRDIHTLLAEAKEDIQYRATVDGYRNGHAGGPKDFEALLDAKACKLPDGAEAFREGRQARLLEIRSGSLAGTLLCRAVAGYVDGHGVGSIDREDGKPPCHFLDDPGSPRGWWAMFGQGYFNGEAA